MLHCVPGKTHPAGHDNLSFSWPLPLKHFSDVNQNSLRQASFVTQDTFQFLGFPQSLRGAPNLNIAITLDAISHPLPLVTTKHAHMSNNLSVEWAWALLHTRPKE